MNFIKAILMIIVIVFAGISLSPFAASFTYDVLERLVSQGMMTPETLAMLSGKWSYFGYERLFTFWYIVLPIVGIWLFRKRIGRLL